MSGYRRNSYRRGYGSRPQAPGRVAKVNARPGPCRYCHQEIPAGAGQLWREDSGAWSVVHMPAEWSGSPVSGRYIYGCPDETDRMNAAGRFGEPGARSESERLAAVAGTYAAMHDAPRQAGRSYARTSTGARMYERCGHEDYPCCGCDG